MTITQVSLNLSLNLAILTNIMEGLMKNPNFDVVLNLLRQKLNVKRNFFGFTSDYTDLHGALYPCFISVFIRDFRG